MIGLVLITGLVAVAIVGFIAHAVGRHLLEIDVVDLRHRQQGQQRPQGQQGPRGSFASDAPLPARPVPPPVATPPPPAPAHPAGPGANEPDDDRTPPLRGRASLSLKARLAFVYSPKPGAVVLDCTLVEFDDDVHEVVPAGAPFTLELSLPGTAWFATSLELLLEQWASECRVVEIALRAGDGHAKAHVGDGASRLMLDVDSAAGLSVG